MENQNSDEEKLPQLRANVYDAIGTERYYQEQKWGSIEEHPLHKIRNFWAFGKL